MLNTTSSNTGNSKLEGLSDLDSDLMVLDKQTFRDFEIFEADMGGESLFKLCNHTRNKQGAQALRKRMEPPFSNPARIRAVQESISFILEHRQAFDPLPSFANTEVVERYFHGALPLVTSINPFEFGAAAIELRFGDFVRFFTILHGVKSTAIILSAMRKLVQAIGTNTVGGELKESLEEVQALLAREKLAEIPDLADTDINFWTALRYDQVFRIHEKLAISRLLKLIYEIDALLAMAITTHKHNFIMPEIEEGPLSVKATGVVHPHVENMVSNPVELNQNCRLLFLTGPNMAGKTTYLRASAISLYLAHLGMGVPAKTFSFVPAQRIFSSITMSDNLHNGVSFFHAEALRIKELAQALNDGYRVIALMDEPFKGTNVKDAFDASSAIMESFSNKKESMFMFSSHLIELCDQMTAIDQVDCRYFEAGENEGRLSFEYTLRKGVSSQRLGMRVLQEEGVFDLLNSK